MIANDVLFELARVSGLPISWWQRAREAGERREWRELDKFASLIIMDVLDVVEGYKTTNPEIQQVLETLHESILERFGIGD